MKKMFTLVMTLFAFSALFAQRDKLYDDNGNTVYNNRRYNDDNIYSRPDQAVAMRRDEGRWNDNGLRMNDHDRRVEMDRLNKDYDRRINDYRNDRRMNSWQRSQAIERLKKERTNKLKAFGGGVVLGGILGVLLGSQL